MTTPNTIDAEVVELETPGGAVVQQLHVKGGIIDLSGMRLQPGDTLTITWTITIEDDPPTRNRLLDENNIMVSNVLKCTSVHPIC